jgi:hypothetical protein
MTDAMEIALKPVPSPPYRMLPQSYMPLAKKMAKIGRQPVQG